MRFELWCLDYSLDYQISFLILIRVKSHTNFKFLIYSDQNKHTQNNGHNRSQIYDSENPINEILDLPSISSTALNSTTTIATDVSSISTTSTLILERQLPDAPNHEPTNMETTGGKKKESRFPKMPAFLKKKRKSKDKSNPELSQKIT